MRYKYLAVWMAIASVAAPVSAQSVKAGIEAWQRSDYAAAVTIWRPLAESGDADAAFNLGQAYRLGRGVPLDLAAAQTSFERAAAKGHLDAETTLGLLLFQNGNRIAGLRWLKAASEKGEPRAMLVYGTALFNGDGAPQDPVLGYAYVSRAAAQGLPAAKDTLAQLDQILPLAERKKGVALAIAKAKTAPAPATKTEPKPAKPVTKTLPVAAKTPILVAKTPPPAAKPQPTKPAVAASGAWRIQLGAFSQRSSAEALFRKLSGNGALAGRQAYYIPVGAITRLQVGPFESRASASAACSALKGQACFAVK
ncbi:MAG TPA: SPOR domain-containing protein [Sphingomicrobium sp.]|nr:SPOR domain-containing protein [Sphingomicrobium sp.]